MPNNFKKRKKIGKKLQKKAEKFIVFLSRDGRNVPIRRLSAILLCPAA